MTQTQQAVQQQQQQQAAGARAHIFASANLTAMNVQQAYRAMHTQLQRDFQAELWRYIAAMNGGAAAGEVTVRDALGVWRTGAEPSAHVTWQGASATAVRVVAEQARQAFKQEAVLTFVEGKGSHALWEVRPQGGVTAEEFANQLAELWDAGTVDSLSGLAGSAWVVDETRALAADIAWLAARHAWDVTMYTGTAELVVPAGIVDASEPQLTTASE